MVKRVSDKLDLTVGRPYGYLYSKRTNCFVRVPAEEAAGADNNALKVKDMSGVNSAKEEYSAHRIYPNGMLTLEQGNKIPFDTKFKGIKDLLTLFIRRKKR